VRKLTRYLQFEKIQLGLNALQLILDSVSLIFIYMCFSLCWRTGKETAFAYSEAVAWNTFEFYLCIIYLTMLSESVTLNIRMINKRIQKGAVVLCVKLLSRHSSGGIEENHEKLQSLYLLPWPKCVLSTSRIRAGSIIVRDSLLGHTHGNFE
jgi:hypothetical protein